VAGPSTISIDGISKRFNLYAEKASSLKERIVRLRRSKAREFWALRDVSYEIPAGRTVGLVGANGSGKTTLLKVIGGIIRPTAGTVTTRGRIAALLELGAGFHPELTGRENVYLNASILGLTKKETDRHFDAIVAFAELESFIDQQVKYYSSGMFVRLGFAVAVHVDPQILLVDEVLAVGDEGFQRKCIERVKQFQAEGRTIVFVTHAVDLVRRICDEAVMLDHGKVAASGDVESVISELRTVLLQQHAYYAGEQGTRDLEIVSAEVYDDQGRTGAAFHPGDTVVVQVDLKANTPVENPVVSIGLTDGDDQFVFGTNTDWRQQRWPVFEGKQRVKFVLRGIPFVEGRYSVTLGAHSRDVSTVYHSLENHLFFDVSRGEENTGRVFIPVEVQVEPL